MQLRGATSGFKFAEAFLGRLKIKNMSIGFRVDCSSEIGSGHLMRCIRLSNP